MKKLTLLTLFFYFFLFPIKASAAENYFGDGSDGAVTISSNTSLTNTADGDYVVKEYSSLTINSGITLTTQNRAKGLFIYVTGDAVINGTISMTARGANANPTTAGVSSTGLRLPMLKSGSSDTLSSADFAGAGSAVISAVANQGAISGNGKIYTITRTGGAGAAYISTENTNGLPGGILTNGSGGGGSGAKRRSSIYHSGAGAAGTSFSGGSGGGGECQASGNAWSGVAYGGAGGAARGEFGVGGGAGNPGGAGADGGSPGDNGTGGVIWLVVGGNLTIGSNGSIEAEGSDGGDGGSIGGGATGGGVIRILYAGSLSNSGTVSIAGGIGGDGNPYVDGGNGGAGHSILEQVDPALIPCEPTLGDSTHTITSSCSFTGYTDATNGSNIVSGLDSGTGTTNTSVLTVESGTLTISANESLVFGSVELTGGSILISTGGKLIPDGSLWAMDADSDDYPAETAFYARTTTLTNGVRLNSISNNILYADCNDSNAGLTADNYFGDGSDGNVTISSNTSLTNNADEDYVFKEYNSLTINSGVTLTTQNRSRGLFIYVKGNAIINGTLSMTDRGASVNPVTAGVSSTGLRLPMIHTSSSETLSSADFTGAGFDVEAAVANQSGISSSGIIFEIVRTGGLGPTGSTTGDGASGGTTANGTGGGAAGGIRYPEGGRSGDGGDGTCFSGGAAGGGTSGASHGGDASNIGSNGGNGAGDFGTGGAGNPGGSSSGLDGTGGVIWLVVGGNLTIGATGIIEAEGHDSSHSSASGGASGGGVIKIIYAGTLSNSGSISVDGGYSENWYADGGQGGDGSYEIVRVLSGCP